MQQLIHSDPQTSPAVRYTPMIKRMVHNHFRSMLMFGYDFDDLVQEGLYAILNAESQYDPDEPAKESTYYYHVAYNWLAQRVAKYVNRKKRMPLHAVISLDEQIGDQSDSTNLLRHEFIGSVVNVERMAINRAMLSGALARLHAEYPRRYRAVVMKYYHKAIGIEIAEALGVSQTRVNQLIVSGVNDLRRYMRVPGAARPA